MPTTDPHDATPRTLVTGASSGIGAALALACARRGHRLILHGRNPKRLRATADEATRIAAEAGHRSPAPVLFTADLAAADGVDTLLQHVQALSGHSVDVLVNNAGFGTYGAFVDPATDADADQVQVNVVAAFRLAKALLPGMVQRGRGGILNVASTASFQPGPRQAVYYASKAFLLHLSEALWWETRGTGVTVTALCPGPTRSEFHRRANLEDALLLRLPGVWLDADRVAEAGLRALAARKRTVVPGLVPHALGAWLLPRLPRRVTLRILDRLF